MRILIIGHELNTHTHSYIFYGIFKALKYLGHEVKWIYNDEEINKIKNENIKYDVIITELFYNRNIPIIEGCKYIIQQPFIELFKISGWKYAPKEKDYITDEFMNNILSGVKEENIIIWKPCFGNHRNISFIPKVNEKYSTFILPWATDLLPHEIDENIKNLNNLPTTNKVNFIGMSIPPWDEVSKYCKKMGILYKHYGGTFNKESKLNMSTEENMKLIQDSIIAPSVQNEFQVENHYIPCRIFKNISYGKMGVTNNECVNKLFNNKLIYLTNIEDLMERAYDFETKYKDKNKIVKELMEEVRDKHTYISRLNFIFNIIFSG